MRRIALWLIALLLAGNGVAGIVAACVGWQMTTNLLASLRETSANMATQQARLVESVNGVAEDDDPAAQPRGARREYGNAAGAAGRVGHRRGGQRRRRAPGDEGREPEHRARAHRRAAGHGDVDEPCRDLRPAEPGQSGDG